MEFEPSKEDLEQLREWIQKMPHIIQDYDDSFLSAIVRASKGRLQKTKLYLENLNALGLKYPEFCATYDPLDPQLQESLTAWLIFPLPKKNPEDCTVIFSCVNPKCSDASKSHIRECYKYLLLTFYVLIWENDFGSGKWHLMCDIKGCSLGHVKEATAMTVKQILKIGESGVPVRFHSSVTYNLPPILEQIFNLFKLLAKKKIGDRIFAYSSLDKITDYIPLEQLPKEYGGSEESVFVLHDNWKKKVESYRERFLEEERKMRKLDPLRPKTDEKNEDELKEKKWSMEFEPNEEDLRRLREWLKKMPHIIQDYDDDLLLAVLKTRKGSLQKTKVCLEKINAFGMKHPEFFGSYDPLYPPLQDLLWTWLIFPLPEKTPKGCTVILSCLNPKCGDASKSRTNEYWKYLLMTFYIMIWENNVGSAQWIHLGDYEGAGLAHFVETTPSALKKILQTVESSNPFRLHSVIALNAPKMIADIFNFVKFFAKPKVAERVFIYGTADKLTEHVPLKILPKEYGGDGESVSVLHDKWKRKLESYRERLVEEDRKMRELDHLRPKTDEEDEMSGSFRQLNVD